MPTATVHHRVSLPARPPSATSDMANPPRFRSIHYRRLCETMAFSPRNPSACEQGAAFTNNKEGIPLSVREHTKPPSSATARPG